MDCNENDGATRPWDGVDVAGLLELRRLDGGAARFVSARSEDNRNGRVFGGQLLGQALAAARATVPDGRAASALHVLFAHGALVDRPIMYEVDALQDGKRFSSRRVVASQGERTVVEAQVTFQTPAEGLEHALGPHQPVPPPEDLLPMSALEEGGGGELEGRDWAWFQKPCLELRVVDPLRHLVRGSPAPQASFWVRLRTPLADDGALHEAALAYLSDYWINTAALTHHVPLKDVIDNFYVASLNHSLWLHRPCRADEWLLFSTESPSTHNGRSLTIARIYDRAGTLVASAAQECLLAARDRPGPAVFG